MQLQDKVAFITGAGSGIGHAAAIMLAQEGAKIAVLGQSPGNTQRTVDEIVAVGGEALPLVVDVSNPAQMEDAVRQVTEEWGRVDIVLANAGINGVWAPIDELEPEEWDRTMAVNLRGTFLTFKYTVPHLKQRGGSIIVTSSVNGTRMFSNTGATAYACSKAAQVAFTKMTALELAKHRIRVNVICPGSIKTNINASTEIRNTRREKEPVNFPEGSIPLTDGKAGSSEQVAQLVLFLASDASSHISGTEVWIDGAQSLLQG